MVTDVAKSVAFYEAAGFRQTFALRRRSHEYFAELAFGDSAGRNVIMLLAEAEWPETEARASGKRGSGVAIYVALDDLDRHVQRLDQPPAVEELYYGREASIIDPDGYRIVFFEAYPEGERLEADVVRWSEV